MTPLANDNADPLAPARGILTGIVLSAVLWLAAFALAALVLDGASVLAQVLG